MEMGSTRHGGSHIALSPRVRANERVGAMTKRLGKLVRERIAESDG